MWFSILLCLAVCLAQDVFPPKILNRYNQAPFASVSQNFLGIITKIQNMTLRKWYDLDVMRKKQNLKFFRAENFNLTPHSHSWEMLIKALRYLKISTDFNGEGVSYGNVLDTLGFI